MATGRYLLIAFSVQNENTDFKLDFGFQSWECFRRSLVRLTCTDERDTDREIQTWRVYERSECAVLGLNFVPRGILGGRNFCPAYAGRNGFPLKRARGTQIEVSPIAGVAAYTESAFLPLYCSGVVRLTRICAGSWRGIQTQTAHKTLKVHSMKNCRPVIRLQILSRYKENRPAGDQRILSGTSGGKTVWCGCRAVVYHSKVVDMG